MLCLLGLWVEPALPGCIAVVPDTSPSSKRTMQPCSAWAPGRLCTNIVPACRPRQRRKLGTPARSLSKTTVEYLVASSNTTELFELMESELARVSWAQQLLCYCLLCQLPCAFPGADLGCRLLLVFDCGHIGEAAS